MAYIGSGSIDFQGTRIEIRKPFFISGSIGANNKGFLDSSAQIRLSGGDGGPALNTTTTQLGVDHPWESYMELDLHRVLATAAASGFNLVRIGPGDFPGQTVNIAITTAATGSGALANKINLIFSGSGGNAAAGYAGLFADGAAPTVLGTGGGGAGHVGAAWQMIWTGTYWICTQSNTHVTFSDLG